MSKRSWDKTLIEVLVDVVDSPASMTRGAPRLSFVAANVEESREREDCSALSSGRFCSVA
jgi:hypothetical protein